jgi:hypothetical protein
MQPIRRLVPTRRTLPIPANDVDAAMARVVMPIGDEEAAAWDAIVEERARRAA